MDDKKPIAIIAIGIVIVLAGGAWWMSRSAAPTNTSPQAVTSTEAPIDKPGPPPVDLPPRDRMDAFLRPLLGALSARPELANWLATDDLIGQLAMAIDQAAGGGSPARDFRTIAPRKPFVAAGRGTRRSIDPASYQRYDGLILTVTSIDASSVARIYKTIRPRLNEAYQGLGHPNGNVDQAVKAALDILLDTPVVKDPIMLMEGDGVGWAYARADLETLEPTQKQLIRMGSAHVEALLVWLRALQNALN
jgi:hypothetical protein